MLKNAAAPQSDSGPGEYTPGILSRRRQDAHSFFLISAGALLTGTLVVDLVLHREDLNLVVLALLMIAAVTLSVSAIVLGRAFPHWLGLCCVAVLALASAYFISPLGNEQSAVSSMQELPILALYLAWFVRRPLNRGILLMSLAFIALMMILNPVFHVQGELGVAVAIQSIIATYFCFEVGQALWRRTEHETTTDVLTGVLNRAGFMRKLEEETARSLRINTPLSLVVIDFDDFKLLNDRSGHAAGDRALVDTVQHWKEGLRSRDVVGRTGGDEFAILFDRTDARGAHRTMKRLREHSPHAWSWGVSQARSGDTTETMFDRADEKLYAAKRARQ
ncbi:GGDEF domain-containing protein [Leucobacter sp. W1478]|uniref:GGDEF domain-containing protein n=1 Tax=Leucobacter sp. W1478 TaxID=3439065 RepID=UPI003F3BD393